MAFAKPQAMILSGSHDEMRHAQTVFKFIAFGKLQNHHSPLASITGLKENGDCLGRTIGAKGNCGWIEAYPYVLFAEGAKPNSRSITANGHSIFYEKKRSCPGRSSFGQERLFVTKKNKPLEQVPCPKHSAQAWQFAQFTTL
jgi:hypothetical protein